MKQKKMEKTQTKIDNFKVIGLILFIISTIDTYFLLKFDGFSQLFWFCNSALYLLALGFYFRKSILITAVLLGALVVQLPWVLDFFYQLFTGKMWLGVASYMFEYGFDNIRFYIELDHLFIIPLALCGIARLGFNKNGWAVAAIVAIILNAGAFLASSAEDNVNCVFYSCFSDKIEMKEYPFAYALVWTASIITSIFVLSKIIYSFLRKHKSLANI